MNHNNYLMDGNRMKKIQISISIATLFFSTAVFSQNSYLCIPDLATGFSYQKNIDKWNISTFDVAKNKYILTKSNTNKWEWKIFGEKYTNVNCDDAFNEHGYLNCNGFEQIQFNKKNLRFIKIYRLGYVNKGIVGIEGEDTPNMEIGKCSPL